MTDKTWLEVEMDESLSLLRKRLEELNDTHKDDVDMDVSCEIEKIYKAIYYIMSIKKSLA